MQRSLLGQRAIQRALRRLPLVIAPLVIVGSLTATATAAKGPAVIVKVHQASGLVSPYFQLAVWPGAVVRAGAPELVNPTAGTVTVRLDPVDALTTNTLGSAYALASDARHGPTTWLRLSRRRVTLGPHASRNVSVSLAVPTSAAPGDYLAGVSVEALGQSQTTSAGKGVAIGEIDRYGIGVEAKLPGPRHPAVRFTGARVTREPAGLAFLLAASNTGNVILKDVHGSAQVTDGNRVVAKATIQPGTFVSHTSISYPVLAPHEQPTPGASYRVQAVLYFAGRAARLDTTVHFSRAAAVTQENYGGRKLPHSTGPWGEIALVAAVLAALTALAFGLRQRRRPMSRTAGLKLLDRALAQAGDLPVSVALVAADRGAIGRIARALRPRLRRTDRACDLGDDRLLVICPSTGEAAASAVRDDLYEQLSRDCELAHVPIEITVATAREPTPAVELVQRARELRQGDSQAPVDPGDPQMAGTDKR